MRYFIKTPECIKLDSDEEIVCEYLCCIRFLALLRIIFSTLFIIASYFIFIENSIFHKFGAVVLGITFIVLVYRDVLGFIRQGLVVTNKNLITFVGEKFPLDNICFLCESYRSFSTLVFYNHNKIIISCHVYKNLEDFDEFLLSLYKVSKNKEILFYGSDRIKSCNDEMITGVRIKLVEDSVDRLYQT